MARHPYLIVVRATDASIHERWLAGGPRNFDLMVSYSGDQAGRFNQGVEYYQAMKGPQWPAFHALFAHYQALLGDYEHVAFVSGDIDGNARFWNTLFHYCNWFALDLAHPSVPGNAGTDITRPQPESILRYVSVVDSLAPVFAKRALTRVLPTFAAAAPDLDLPSQWSKQLPWPEYRSAIVDTVRISHPSPARSDSARSTPEAREHARLRLVHEDV